MVNLFKMHSTTTRFLLAMLLLLFAVPISASAQKITNKKVWTTYHKTPVVALTPKYTSYSIEYDYGDMVAPTGERPALQGLEYKKTDGDLTLKIRVKSVYSANKELKQETGTRLPKSYYDVFYKADYGYDLVEKASGEVVAFYKREGGTFSTPAFSSKIELDIYLKNALVSDLTKYLIDKVNNRVSYDLNPSKFQVRLVGNSIEGEAPCYQEINKATNEFTSLIAAPEIDKEKLRSMTEIWETHLRKVNWENKKSEINKKVAIALIENLCAAYLLMEDYQKLTLAAELSASKNKGLLADWSAPSFEIDGNYPGPSTYQTSVLKNGLLVTNYAPRYLEFATDLASK